MLTMSTTTHIPVEVYLRSSYEPDAEYVDGVIEERPPGENDHSTWQVAYSVRSASIGSIDAARRAGIRAAINPITGSITATPT